MLLVTLNKSDLGLGHKNANFGNQNLLKLIFENIFYEKAYLIQFLWWSYILEKGRLGLPK